MSWLIALASLTGCELASPSDLGALAPPTAERDPALPQLAVTVAGRRRALHLETFGDPSKPVVLAFHGGGGNDYRAMLPLRGLADRYFLVMWDARGSGLSERITRAEISWPSYVEEVDAVKAHFSPDRPVTLIGYSAGGLHAAIYASARPAAVSNLVLVEPDGLSRAAYDKVQQPSIGLTAAYVNEHLWQVDFLSPSDHDAIDRKVFAVARDALASIWCDPAHPGVYPFWRHGIFVDIVTQELLLGEGGFSFTPGLATFPGRVLFVGSDCGPLRAEWQQQHNMPLFPRGELVRVPGHSHGDLFTEQMVVEVGAWLDRGGTP